MGKVRDFGKAIRVGGWQANSSVFRQVITGAAVTEAPGNYFSEAILSARVHVLLQTWSALLPVGKGRCSDCPTSSSPSLQPLASTAWCFDNRSWWKPANKFLLSNLVDAFCDKLEESAQPVNVRCVIYDIGLNNATQKHYFSAAASETKAKSLLSDDLQRYRSLQTLIYSK